jgi:tRNA-2-methylthio-N6-dimethylallyladenosine synthase
MNGLTYWLETYGCQMNKAESDALQVSLQEHEIRPASGYDDADVIILNTCSVRKTAENRAWGRIGFYKKLKNQRPFIFVVMGCMSQRLQKKLQEQCPEIDIVTGSFGKPELLSAIQMVKQNGRSLCLTAESPYTFSRTHTLTGFKSFVPIMHGCNNFCSYCIVPFVRGREISRAPAAVIREITELEARGIKEVTLLGQNVNSYSYSSNGATVLFPDVLRIILNSIHNIRWVRFLTSHPKDVSPKLIELMSADDRLCRHIHLPVQHGSNAVLTRMRRGYTRKYYLDLIESVKNAVSDISITTDILIGFPGETKEDFDMTYTLLQQVEFDDAYTYYYNPREGTAAAAMEDTVPHELKIERLQRIIELQTSISRNKKKKKLYTEVTVLAEDISKHIAEELLARTEHDDMVVFPGRASLVGSFVRVKLTALRGNTFQAALCT